MSNLISKQELKGMAQDIVLAFPGSRVHVEGVGEYSTLSDGRVCLDRGVVDPRYDVDDTECPGQRRGREDR